MLKGVSKTPFIECLPLVWPSNKLLNAAEQQFSCLRSSGNQVECHSKQGSSVQILYLSRSCAQLFTAEVFWASYSPLCRRACSVRMGSLPSTSASQPCEGKAAVSHPRCLDLQGDIYCFSFALLCLTFRLWN